MHIEALRRRLRAAGARPVHEERVLRQWVRAEPQAKGRQRPEDFLPLSLRTALPALEAELQALAVLRADHPSTDGSRRLLVGLADGTLRGDERIPVRATLTLDGLVRDYHVDAEITLA